MLGLNYGVYIDSNTEYDAEDLIPLSQLWCNPLSLTEEIIDDSDKLNVLNTLI